MLNVEISEKCILHVPQNKEIIDTPIAIAWFDDGILYTVAKNIPRTIDKVKETFKIIKERTGNKKVCLIADITQTPPYTKEVRELLDRESNDVYKALAAISCSPKGEMISAILFLGKKPYPAKVFDNPEDAKKWIMKYK